jgi:hypothetical protein
MRKLFFTILISLKTICLTSLYGYAIPIQVHGHFNKDTVKLGEAVSYSLVATYTEDKQIIYPDSTYYFYPFVLWTKSWYSTEKKGGYFKDSVVYRIALFEIQHEVAFAMPVYEIVNGDSVAIFAKADTVHLQEVFRNDMSTELQEFDEFETIGNEFNYPVFFMWFTGFILLSIVIWRYFRLYFEMLYLRFTYWLAFERFIVAFRERLQTLQKKHVDAIYVQKALAEWKNYVGELYDLPFATYTSKEVFNLLHDERLLVILQEIDKVIYGGEDPKSLTDAFLYLKEKSKELFKEKSKELGKRV